MPLEDQLWALGWSRNNAFAYLERRQTDQGQRNVRIRVMDLVEDKVLWEQQWPDWGDQDGQAAWWPLHETEVQRVFGQFGLEPTELQLGTFPLILGEDFYSLSLRSTRRSDDPTWIERLEVAVNSTGRGLKTVSEGSGFWRWATLLGFVPSPYEGRVALLILVQPAGWQGAKQPLRFLVTGLSLKAGFPKP